MWVTMKIRKWHELLFPELPFVQVEAPEDQVGYIPVFKTYEDALKAADWDDNMVFEVRFKGDSMR